MLWSAFSRRGCTPCPPPPPPLAGALNPWLSLPASMVWGAAADRWDAHRPIMLACLLGTALVRCMLIVADTFASILAVSLAVTVRRAGVAVSAPTNQPTASLFVCWLVI